MIYRVLIGLLIVTQVVACGFHLRGSQPLPDELESIAVTTSERNSLLARALIKRLEVYQIPAVEAGENKQKTIVISLTPEQLDRRLLSVFATGQVAEYELIYTARYTVNFPDGKTYSSMFEVLRDYQDDPEQVLAKSRELDLVLNEMRLEAADRIIRLLSSQYSQVH